MKKLGKVLSASLLVLSAFGCSGGGEEKVGGISGRSESHEAKEKDQEAQGQPGGEAAQTEAPAQQQ